MNMLKCCLNGKVVAGLAVMGIGLWALAPGLVSSALPLLVLAICPLSMLFMMRAMRGQQDSPAPREEPQPETAPAPAQVDASTDSTGRVQA